MHSARFNLPVVLTQRAIQRMAERDIDAALILEVIDTGTVKNAGGDHYWLIQARGAA